MVQILWVIFARIPVLIELHFAYDICVRLLFSFLKMTKTFSTLEGKVCISSFRRYFIMTSFQQQSPNLVECKYLSFTGVALKPFATSTDHSWLEGNVWYILTSSRILVCSGPDTFAGRRGNNIFQRKHWVNWALVISDLCKAFHYTAWVFWYIMSCDKGTPSLF